MGVMECPLCLMERESVVTVMGPSWRVLVKVATHIYLPKPTRQPSAFVSAFRGRAAAPLIGPRDGQ
jgi:hypothetical protein